VKERTPGLEMAGDDDPLSVLPNTIFPFPHSPYLSTHFPLKSPPLFISLSPFTINLSQSRPSKSLRQISTHKHGPFITPHSFSSSLRSSPDEGQIGEAIHPVMNPNRFLSPFQFILSLPRNHISLPFRPIEIAKGNASMFTERSNDWQEKYMSSPIHALLDERVMVVNVNSASSPGNHTNNIPSSPFQLLSSTCSAL
jgi:hypothetical protein